ncbi:MAG: type III-B CRISPR module RAMP protein Cmr1 [Candidatus Binatia bacterium]|nr:type III-B CRISPR module RAMP protein Cmr1 [Candidatus Binatia bacterium]
MKSQETLEAQLRIVTPVFCAGAEQNGASEIRPFSIRGALRWWYRAVAGDSLKEEASVFGATTGNGTASPIALQLGSWLSEETPLDDRLQPKRAPESGAAYLGYTLYLGSNNRKAVTPGKEPVTLRLRWNWKPASSERQQYIRRAWAASLWLFGHLGGLGTRARRGFGTLALENWTGWEEETGLLGTAHGAASPEQWKERFDSGFQKIGQWFPAPTGALHQHVSQNLQVYLWRTGKRSWDQALDEIGKVFQDFRRRPEIHRPELLAAFGLPIRFRRHPARFARPEKFNRAASPLQIRVVPIGSNYHPMVWRAAGPLVPKQELRLSYSGHYSDQPPREWDRALEQFLDHIRPHCV